MPQICLVSPSISATSPASRSVTEKMLFRLMLFIFLVGRWSTGTCSFQVPRMSVRLHSGGASGGIWI